MELRDPARNYFNMSERGQELLNICEALAEEKREELADFARFLLARQDDERWEQLVDFPARRPKLDAFLKESAAEPEAAFDPKRL